ncbi:MAG: hypothetical protein KDC44_03380, partial [Phaeodactylibacter sp.]|nr:hypothetical protein [Phaeodactylibacter sp.]
MQVRVFGIRHHGPGSARTLVKALEHYEPDCLLIEGPADADELIELAAMPGLKPPVALLIYDPKSFDRSFYFPFAHFSPEWQAIQWGLKQQVPVHFMDLPISMILNLPSTDLQPQLALPWEQEASSFDARWQRDPLGLIAQLAGYTDSERWWEAAFEAQENPVEVFPIILDMIRALRQEGGIREKQENLLREAFMRKQIRTAVKEGFRKVAVVCGAWHSPALDKWATVKQAADNALLRGIKKTKTQATWIPWSYDRLSFQSGYRSGVISPAWYDLLFSRRDAAVQHWMIRAARLLRKEERDVSSAHVIEAVRLAETLSAIRGLSVPGLEELKEAALSTFCEGDQALLQLVEAQLAIGDRQGKVPGTIPQVPLQKDLEAQIKKARLTAEWSTTERVRKELDLRKPANLVASYLLHRLPILGLEWGSELQLSGDLKGTFREKWSLKWNADFSIRLIEAGLWGNTIEEAATNKLKDLALKTKGLLELTELIQQALKASLEDSIALLAARLEQAAAQTHDIIQLLQSLPALIQIVRYGDSRQTDVELVIELVEEMVPRICIGLPAAAMGIDDAAAADLQEMLLDAQQAIGGLSQADTRKRWTDTIEQMARSNALHPLLSGTCVRLAYERGTWTSEA